MDRITMRIMLVTAETTDEEASMYRRVAAKLKNAATVAMMLARASGLEAFASTLRERAARFSDSE